MNYDSASMFLGSEVQIYPGDSDKKFGIVKAVDDHGVTFKITNVQGNASKSYKVGTLHFISYASRLSMREV